MSMMRKNMNVVLVHGAWADGSSWRETIGPLRAAGLDVVAAPLPLTSLHDDVAALEHALERIDGPAVLVGHAYAGAVIGQVRSERVRALVYVAALAPDEGETVADVFYRGEPHSLAPKLAPDAHGSIWLPREAFAGAFAQNASASVREWLAAVQRPIAVPCISTPVGRPRWKDVPAWYLLAEDDRMISRETQAFLAGRMKATVVARAVDHTPSVTAPDAVVAVILAAVDAAKGQ
jgi:pimeloyl-ACP methyl ester carboxylesterase